jgi:AcrR family transcriptional regulator
MSAAGQARKRSRTPSARVEQDLISAAEAVLVRDGATALTVRAVAKEAKIAPMGVYNRLGSKAGLVNVLLIRAFDRLRTALETGQEPGPLDRLRQCALRYRRFALDNPAFYAIMFENASRRENESAEVRDHAAAAFGVLLRNVELATAAGRIDATEPREAAQQLWSAVHGAVVLELKGLLQTPDPEATYREMAETMLRGLGRGPGKPGPR